MSTPSQTENIVLATSDDATLTLREHEPRLSIQADTTSTTQHVSNHVLENISEEEEHGVKQSPTAQDASEIVSETVPKKKKKKGKRGSKMSGGLAKPSGFEEFYVDPPITADEFNEEKALYAIEKPVNQRILIAVQRFTARRKFDPEQKEIFDRYLKFGGIDAGQNAFLGGMELDAKDMTATEIANVKTTQILSQAVLAKEVEVDFDGTLKAFLSCNSPTYFVSSSFNETKRRVYVIRNFLNYLLHHNVCTEYTEQINAAKATCECGASQLYLLGLCSRMLPGAFNVSCSTLFTGWYKQTYNANADWGKENKIDPTAMTLDQARNCFTLGMASNASTEVFEAYRRQTNAQLHQELHCSRCSLEVVDILGADDEARGVYGRSMQGVFKCLGKLKAVRWQNPADCEQDLTEEEAAELSKISKEPEEFEFWLEEDILEKIFIGMKFEAQVYQTSFGLSYFDMVGMTACSFFDYIPNDMMVGWRNHVYLPPREGQPIELEVFNEE